MLRDDGNHGGPRRISGRSVLGEPGATLRLVAHSDILQILPQHPRDGSVRCRGNEWRTETCPKERMVR